MAANPNLTIEFKKLFMEYATSREGNASQITTQYAKATKKTKEVNRQKKEDVKGYNAEMDARIAHFWDAEHEFWKRPENLKYEINSNSHLPTGYTNLNSFKKQVAKVTPDQPVTPPTTVVTKKSKLSIADEKRLLERRLLILKYTDYVESAQNELKKVQAILDKDLTLSTQEELDNILNSPVPKKEDTLDLEI